MLLTEFDEKAYIDGVKKQSYEEGEAIGEARGEARGKIKGEEKLARLVVELKKRGRVEDIAKVTDESERERLYGEFNIWGFNIVQLSEWCIQYAIILTQFKQLTLLSNNWMTSLKIIKNNLKKSWQINKCMLIYSYKQTRP